MKNMTIRIPEQVARWARVWAARHDTSVSRLVGEMLTERMEQERGYQSAMKTYLGRSPSLLKGSGDYPKRDEIHERDLLR
jgi:plasmid stability protein